MRRLKGGVAWAAALLLALAASSAAKSPKKTPRARAADFDVSLPVLGTKLEEFPPGPAKAIADQSCLQCHSASMALQQRLNEKQWTASVEKMMRWGAAVPADKKDELIAYLVANFGTDNDRFAPVVTRPVGK